MSVRNRSYENLVQFVFGFIIALATWYSLVIFFGHLVSRYLLK